jgi:hypothetical protein
MMTKDEKVELFVIRMTGLLATAFRQAELSPGWHWPILRGERDPTLRDVAEISWLTGLDLTFSFGELNKPEAKDEWEAQWEAEGEVEGDVTDMHDDHTLRVAMVTDDLDRQDYKEAPLGECCVILHGSLEAVQRAAALLGKRVFVVEARDERGGK